ncbi:MAG TPA: hypothetical protein VFE24_17400 [Pirellulales bacterium]|nr:hypothetical protein [Pirellulales bacterium]
MNSFDDDEDDFDEGDDDYFEDDAAAWDDDTLEEPTFPCPNCDRLIHEEAEQCPYCGEYILNAARRRGLSPPSLLFLAGLLACLLVTLMWVFW